MSPAYGHRLSFASACCVASLVAGVPENNLWDEDFGVVYGEDAVARARSPETALKLHMMPDKGLSGMGAVCLDGTDVGFYFAPASDPKNANDWQLYFQGGGWCYDKVDCWGRSNGNLGSSKGWAQTIGAGGIMSDDCNTNPDFCNFNRVFMVYCDGNSFSGNRDEPVVVKGLDGKDKPLYFRGRRVLDAVLTTLNTMGLQNAENVLLTGCSAGGLATYLHTDYVGEYLSRNAPNLKQYKSAPISGFFLLAKNVNGEPVYPREMEEIFGLANSTHGVNEDCIRAGPDGQWKCNFAEYAYAHTKSPIFILNSALDSWQTGCIFTSDLLPDFPDQNSTANGKCALAQTDGHPWTQCSSDPEKCTSDQMIKMNQYMKEFDDKMNLGTTYSQPGNGAFVHSCHMHCEAQTPAYNTIEINGVTMQQAVSKWWNSHSEPSADHSYTPCQYNTDALPHMCNPTCLPKSHAPEAVDPWVDPWVVV